MCTNGKQTVPLLYELDFLMYVSLQEEACTGIPLDKMKLLHLSCRTFTYFRPHVKLLVTHVIQFVQLCS
jgi:hypothetical protein